MSKVHVVGGDKEVIDMFCKAGWSIVFDVKNADLACFTGGADVNPFLYGERPLSKTYFSTLRDNAEIKLWKSLPAKFPKVGICRGAQLGNVLCGGSLWQHVDNHTSRHAIKDLSGIWGQAHHRLLASSSHHQMCIPSNDALIIAVANKSSYKENESTVKTYGPSSFNNYDDVEAFFYDNFNFLGVQFHPEYTDSPNCTLYFFQLIKEFMELGDYSNEAVSNLFTIQGDKVVLEVPSD